MSWEIHTISRIYGHNVQAGLPDGRWVRAVPEPYTAGSLKAAWAVLTGRAFALRWPEAGELEAALAQGHINRAKRTPAQAAGERVLGDERAERMRGEGSAA